VTEADLDDLVTALADPEISRWTTVPSPYGPDEARTWAALASRTHRERTALHLLVTERRSGALLGSVGAASLDWDGLVAEVGYWVAAPARRRGVASGALALLSGQLLQLGMQRCFAQVMAGNVGSERVLERVGYRREGVLRSMPTGRAAAPVGERADLAVFSLLPSDPAGRRLVGLDIAVGRDALGPDTTGPDTTDPDTTGSADRT
jgi:RimJ/RimL family protein N-acetyltransferase